MKRILLAIAIAAPLLSGCIIIATEEPSSAHSTHHDND